MTDIYVIDGPPGTGKTRYLSDQAARAAQAHGIASVAICSLTRTAASEIGSRVDIPDEHCSTLHAAAYRGLDHPDLAETPEGLRAWNQAHPADQLTINGSRQAMEDAADTTNDAGQTTQADDLHARCANHRARLTPPDQWTQEERDYQARWTDFKTQTNRLDFTDLIEHAVVELPEHPAGPVVLLLDEAQDFSALELKLALQWAQRTQTTVICADTRQALYSWRGADPDALDTMTVTGRRTLSQSYRVPNAVHAYAQAWAHQLHAGPANYQPTSQPGRVDELDATTNDPAALIASIRHDLANGHEAMVLTSCGYMLAPIIRELRAAGIPFHNPHRATQGAWNPMRSAHRLASFLRHDPRVWGDKARTWTWGDLWDWIEPMKAAGVLPRGVKTLIEHKCEPDRYGESNRGHEVDVDVVCELLGDTGDLKHPALRGDVTWWHQNLLATRRPSLDYPVQVLQRTGPAALRADPQVVVGTIHSVKGAETTHCYLAPDLSRVGYHDGWMPRGPGHQAIVRMGYVAITRARHQVTLLQPAGPENIHPELRAAIKQAA